MMIFKVVNSNYDGALLTAMLIERRLAVPYHGQAKADVAEAHARNHDFLVADGKIE